MFLKVLPFYRNEVTRQAPIFFAGYSPDPWAEHVAEEPSFAKLGLNGLPILSSSISKPKLGLNWATKNFRQLAIGMEKLGFNWATKIFLQPYVGKIRPELGSKKKFGSSRCRKNLALTGLQFVWAAVGSEIRPQLGFKNFAAAVGKIGL